MDNSDLEYSVQMMLQDPDAFQNTSRLRSDLPYLGFDNSCGKNWIYPINYPKREYQYSICKKALFQNTLVALPTGLGKTFIAAVVMYNFYRWYPRSKVIFMAPSRPLVTQQIDACYEIMGIPKEDTVEITGRKSKKDRREFWKDKRVFYATPQAVLSDIVSLEDEFPVNDIRLVVVDEAHRAKGKYAYTEVIRLISERNRTFRVLALSATPGRDIKDVKEISENLMISHIEARCETSIDVMRYVFKKLIKQEVVPFDTRIKRIRAAMIEIIKPYVQVLTDAGVLHGNVASLTKGSVIMAQNGFRSLVRHENPAKLSELKSNFSTCVSLYHSLEVLERNGARMFLNSFLDEGNSTGYKYFVHQNHHLKEMLEELRQEMGVTQMALDRSLNQSVKDDPNFDYGHPKFRVLERKLLEHFTNDPNSKVIVFCELRETVMLIDILLSQHKPLIRSRKMVGQGSSSGIKAVTQKEQAAVMEEFRAGRSNCLIATCVVEEGIDVGDVMMIVCFDSNTNPTRYVQRIGRTGRKQQGNVLMLVAEGRERDNLQRVLNQKDKLTQRLSNSNETKGFLRKDSPRLVPPEFNPECLEVFFEVKPVVEAATSKAKKSKETGAKVTNKGKKSKKDTQAVGTDMRNFFKPLNLSIDEDFEQSPVTSPVRPERRSRLPKPKPPVASTSTMIDFSMEQSMDAIDERPADETDPEWSKLRVIQKNLQKKYKRKTLVYATDKEILDYNGIGEDLKTFLLRKDTHTRNSKIDFITKETQDNFNRILQESERYFNPQRLESLLECVKNVETLLKDDDSFVVHDDSSKDTVAYEEPQFEDYIPPDMFSQPLRNYKPLEIETPQLKTFDPAYAQVPAQSTPIRKIPSGSKFKPHKLNSLSDEKEKINEQEVLNSLGLKSLDDLFADDDDDNVPLETIPEPKNVITVLKPTEIMKNVSNLTKKRSSEIISSPNTTKNRHIKLEFVDLENILGSSDDDLFDETDNNKASPPKIVKSNDISINPDADLERHSPNTFLEKEICRLNSSLSDFLAAEILESEKDCVVTPKSVHKTGVLNNFSTPKSTKIVPHTFKASPIPEIVLTEPRILHDSVQNCKTPVKNRVQQGNQEISPSIFNCRYSSQIKKSYVRHSSEPISNQTKFVQDTSPMTQVIRPVLVRNKRQRKILSDSEEENEVGGNGSHQKVKRQKTVKKKAPKTKPRGRRHCAMFLDNEAGVSGGESEEDDHDMSGFSELQDFVVDNTETFNETIGNNMFAKYVESTRSPRNRNRFKIPEQLRPFNREEIFSQVVPIEASQYDLNDSFVVVDEEEEETQQEMSALEIAEARIEAERREKKRRRQLMS